MSAEQEPSPKEIEHAEVFRHGVRIGVLQRTRTGSVFEYAPEFLATAPKGRGAAVHLPYSQRRFETRGVNLHPYFAGLLPEGLRLDALILRLRTSADDLFSLLIATGEDTVGDLVVRAATGQQRPPRPVPAELAQTSFAELFEASLERLGAGSQEPTIPGVQAKVSAAMVSFPVSLASRREAHILKLSPPTHPRLVENEAFFMAMAKDCGLATAKTQVVHDRDGHAGLLVTRFDRHWSKERRELVAVHQEDGCQLLDRYPADKYRITCSELAEALEVCAAPIPERANLLHLIAFSYLIGNGDLHAKNVSVAALGPQGGLRLAPAYDVLSTLPYGDRKMALKLDGRDDGLEGRYLVAFGERLGVREASTRKMLEALHARAEPWIARIGEIGLDAKRTRDLERVMRARREELVRLGRKRTG